MDTFEQASAYFSSLPVAAQWEEMQSLFRRVADGRPKHWLLPVRACEAVGGTPEQAIPAVAAIACAHIGIILVDDMLDDDPRGEYRRIGAPSAANLAGAFQSAALEAVTRPVLSYDAQLAALGGMNTMFLSTALGQAWDVQSPNDEETYWRVVRTKSSPFFGAALHIGALMGGATVPIAEQLKDLGSLYGEMIQIHDDLNDCLESPANPDWIQGRSPLPILFAKLVDHPDRARFLDLCRDIATPRMQGGVEEAQGILIRCGAVSYCVDQLLRRYVSARARLDANPPPNRQALDDLLEDVVTPVWKLFESIGETPPDLSAAGWLADPG